MGGLRAGTRHHGKIIATQKPQMRTIFWQDGTRQHIMLPHSQYVIYYTRGEKGNSFKYWLNRLHVAFSLDEFTCNLDERLYGMPLANYDVGLAICFYEWPASNDPKQFAETVISQYWASPYQDYRDSFSHWLDTYQAQKPEFSRTWLQASKKRNYEWLMEQALISPPYNVSLKKLFDSNKTETDETDYFKDINGTKSVVPNMTDYESRVRQVAERKWREAGCPSGQDVHFWYEAEKEVK